MLNCLSHALVHSPNHAKHIVIGTTGSLPLRMASCLAVAAGLGGSPLLAGAVVLAGWDVHSLPGGVNNFGASPLAASTAAANLAVGGLSRGSGVGTTGTAASRGWGGNDWLSTSAAAAATAGDAVSFTVVASAGYQVSISGISRLDYRRSSAGPASGVLQYQVGAGAFTDAATLSFSSTAASGASIAAIDLSGVAALQNVPAGTSITFRLLNYGASGAGGTWYLFDQANTTASDLELSGTVTTSGPPVAGVCGPAHGLTFPVPPTANLCSSGGASAITGTGPWGWTCAGSGGGQPTTCSANSSAATGC
jgi:hypothetical protein